MYYLVEGMLGATFRDKLTRRKADTVERGVLRPDDGFLQNATHQHRIHPYPWARRWFGALAGRDSWPVGKSPLESVFSNMYQGARHLVLLGRTRCTRAPPDSDRAVTALRVRQLGSGHIGGEARS